MVDPNAIVDNLITLLRSISALVTEMGSNANKIVAYKDTWPDATSFIDAVSQMTAPSMLIAWDGTGPAQAGTREQWSHRFKIALRSKNEAGDSTPDGYAKLWEKFVNGVPSSTVGDGQPLHRCRIHSACLPMDPPSINRVQILVDPTNNTVLEYFEITFTVRER